MKDAHIHFHRQPYSLEIVSKMVESAVQRGVDEINLLDHTSKFKEFQFLYEETKNEPAMYAHYHKEGRKYLSIEEYLSFIALVKQQSYPIKINFGLEVCYFENAEEELRKTLSNYHFDFLVGSVHHVDGFGYDYGKETWTGRDVDQLWKRYYEIMEKLIKSRLFTHLAHPDALKIYDLYPSFDLHPYFKKVARLLKEYNMSTEDNYGFIRYGLSSFGLDKDFLSILEDEGVKVYKSSDAHDYCDVGRFRPIDISKNKVKKVAIVSLSRGIIGEPFVKHEIDIGLQRLKDFGLEVVFMPNALKGLEYIKNHPEDRAKDLLDAFQDDSIDMILCAIGGDDTYRLLPYLFNNNKLQKKVKDKIFLGFSDTTFNHFMLRKVGLNTFYGQAFFSDVCELATDMLPYSKQYFMELIQTGTIKEITPASLYYKNREDFSKEAIGSWCESFINEGFISLQGPKVFKGQIFGGCLDSIYDMFDNSRYSDTVELCNKYELFPCKDEWKGKILLLETSEETPSPDKVKQALQFFKNRGVFDAINGIIVGKPMNEIYFEEYKSIFKEVIDNPDLPIVYNVNIGHSVPRCIIPFGKDAVVDVENQIIKFY